VLLKSNKEKLAQAIQYIQKRTTKVSLIEKGLNESLICLEELEKDILTHPINGILNN
jgi:hypothetical protein